MMKREWLLSSLYPHLQMKMSLWWIDKKVTQIQILLKQTMTKTLMISSRCFPGKNQVSRWIQNLSLIKALVLTQADSFRLIALKLDSIIVNRERMSKLSLLTKVMNLMVPSKNKNCQNFCHTRVKLQDYSQEVRSRQKNKSDL